MKRVLGAGLLGGVVFVAWIFVVDGLLGTKSRIEMGTLPDERLVYEFLKEHVREPGNYFLNPPLTAKGQFPGEDPVFGIQYTGLGHGFAGQEEVFGLLVFLIAPILGAWLLSRTSERTLSSYPRKVLFLAVIGVVVALFSDLGRFGIVGYSLGHAAALAAHDLAGWCVAGLVVAWRIRPEAPATG